VNFVKAKTRCESTGKRVLTQGANAVKAAILFEVSGRKGARTEVEFRQNENTYEASQKIARIGVEFCQSKNTP
jgi:hypothetical protein